MISTLTLTAAVGGLLAAWLRLLALLTWEEDKLKEREETVDPDDEKIHFLLSPNQSRINGSLIRLNAARWLLSCFSLR